MRYLNLSKGMIGGILLSVIYAQNITVLATRGDVQVEQAGGNWVKATAGMKLSEQQKIRLGQQSYVALVFPGNKARELRQAGTYVLAQLLAQKTSSDDNPYASKYTGYVLNQAVASGAGRASGKTLGAVTRSTMAPMPRTPIQSSFYAEKVQLNWDRVPGSEGYIVQILDESGQVILSREVSAEQTAVELNLEGKVKAGPCYYWRVSTRRHPTLHSNNACFRVLSPEKAAALKREEEAIRRSMDPNSAIDYATLGAFYEQNGLYGYAWNAYNQAATLEPGADGYIALRDELSQRVTRATVAE
ncbi:MAG: hypothetical protein N2253_00060 [Bacteroidia bacterium]|nr:hypothetical protein [Bacteroidia bacterium]MCX7763276.1 hypothetical protein [Bacteroidia bacterium]MDW8057573.1 hypothetical protein [Bacteroidia bacterium]